jgi:hypothetical protein
MYVTGLNILPPVLSPFSVSELNIAVQLLALLLHTREVWIRISELRLAILNAVYHGFSQSLKKVTRSSIWEKYA